MAEKNQDNLFDEWSSLNRVMADWRSRFDEVRRKFKNCKTRKDAIEILRQEGFIDRYPELPDWLE